MKIRSLISLSLVVAAISGCAFDQEARKRADSNYETNKAKVDQEIRKTENRSQNSGQLVTRVKGKWLGSKSIPLVSEESLPSMFYDKWTFSFPGRVNVATAAERVTKVTGVPVFVKPDAYIPLMRLIPSTAGATAGATAMPGATGGVPVVDATQGFGTVNSTAADFSTDMELNFEGTLVDFLNRISSRAVLNWEYKNGRIEFYRITTRNFTLKTSPGDSQFNGSVGKTGTTTGGTTSTGAAAAQSATQSNFSSDSNVRLTTQLSVWASVDTAVRSMMSPVGKVSINQGTGTITVTDLKENVDAVGRFIERENLTLNRQVRMKVEILNVQLSQEYQSGVDWNLVYSRLNSLLTPDFSINLMTPTSLTNAQAGNIGFRISATGDSQGLDRFNGSSAMLKVLNGFGKASIANTTNATTTNRQPVPVALTDQVTYVAATTPVAAVTGGTGGLPGLTPGTVTTGFILNMLPTVQDNGSVLLSFSVDMSELKRLNTVTSGSGVSQQSIQTPEVSSMQFLQRASMRPGETLVLAGFERENNQYDKRTVTEKGDSALSGSISGKNRREAFVIMVTPMIEDN